MFSRVFPYSSYFRRVGSRFFAFFFGQMLFGGINKPTGMTVEYLPEGLRGAENTYDDRQRILMIKKKGGTPFAPIGEVFEYNLEKRLVGGPLYSVDKRFHSMGVVEDRVVFFDAEKNKSKIVSLSDGTIVELDGDYGLVFGANDEGILFKRLAPGEESITFVGEDGKIKWHYEPANAREVLLFEDLEIVVCSIWQKKPNGIYDRCDLLILDANTGETVDTVPLAEPLAQSEWQVVREGQTIYARATEALYAYDLTRRETRRFPIPKVVSTPAFLVANGKAYIGDNEDGNGRLYVISAENGRILGGRLFDGLIFDDMASKVVRFDEGMAMNLVNASETPGWKYARIVSWLDGEMEDPESELEMEPLRAAIERKMVGRDSRCRVGLEAGRSGEEILRHTVVGLESAAHEVAISKSDDTKAYDEDFAGELIADLSNQQLSDEERQIISRALDDFSRVELNSYENAVDQGPVKITAVYP